MVDHQAYLGVFYCDILRQGTPAEKSVGRVKPVVVTIDAYKSPLRGIGKSLSWAEFIERVLPDPASCFIPMGFLFVIPSL
jgi:hypothetical protein